MLFGPDFQLSNRAQCCGSVCDDGSHPQSILATITHLLKVFLTDRHLKMSCWVPKFSITFINNNKRGNREFIYHGACFNSISDHTPSISISFPSSHSSHSSGCLSNREQTADTVYRVAAGLQWSSLPRDSQSVTQMSVNNLDLGKETPKYESFSWKICICVLESDKTTVKY